MSQTDDEYTCEDVGSLLDDFLDGELSLEQIRGIEKHLAECPPCAGERTFEAGVLAELKEQLRGVSAPPSLVEKVDALIRETKADDPGHSGS